MYQKERANGNIVNLKIRVDAGFVEMNIESAIKALTSGSRNDAINGIRYLKEALSYAREIKKIAES